MDNVLRAIVFLAMGGAALWFIVFLSALQSGIREDLANPRPQPNPNEPGKWLLGSARLAFFFWLSILLIVSLLHEFQLLEIL